MSARLTSKVLVSSLLRRVQAEGGFGAVLARGDATSGAILIVLAERGMRIATLERLLQPDGAYAWQESGPPGADEEAFRSMLEPLPHSLSGKHRWGRLTNFSAGRSCTTNRTS